MTHFGLLSLFLVAEDRVQADQGHGGLREPARQVLQRRRDPRGQGPPHRRPHAAVRAGGRHSTECQSNFR